MEAPEIEEHMEMVPIQASSLEISDWFVYVVHVENLDFVVNMYLNYFNTTNFMSFRNSFRI